MKHYTFFLVAVATMAGLVALIAPAPGHVEWGIRPGLRYRNPSRVPRLEMDLLGP